MMMDPTSKQFRRKWSMLLLLPAWLLSHSSASTDTRALSVVGDTFNSFFHYAYTCEVSQYGNSLEEDRIYRAILMRPSGDPHLCVMPDNLSPVESNNTLPVEFGLPVALIVSRGGDCDLHTKIKVALQIQEAASRSMKYIVFYNNDPNNSDSIVPVIAPPPGSGIEIPENIERLSFLSVSTSAGSNIMGFIQKYAEDTGNNPEFLGEGNMLWNLHMLVEQPPLPNTPPPSNTRVNSENFYWFRLILFTLLILSPCCRGGYLWWSGGGRIYFRRNENGRIIGLRYVAPISYWYGTNGAQDATSMVMNRLTEEEVRALPEITYKVPSQTESDTSNEEQKVESTDEKMSEKAEDVDIVISSGSADERGTRTTGNLERIPSVSESLRGSDEEQMPDQVHVTNCTTCSICIEEFETGERLRFLPRCKHAFHTECIMPWLTERQGCCPLCKTSVLQPEGTDGSDSGHEVTVEETDQLQSGSQNNAVAEGEPSGTVPRLHTDDDSPASQNSDTVELTTGPSSSGDFIEPCGNGGETSVRSFNSRSNDLQLAGSTSCEEQDGNGQEEGARARDSTG